MIQLTTIQRNTIVITTAGMLLCAMAIADEPADSSPHHSKFFRRQYCKKDLSFCGSQVCVDFDGDGRRELLFASRKTKQLQLLNAADGTVLWSKKFPGDQQSNTVYDLDGDGDFEIIYSTSGPGRFYVLDHTGQLLRQWDSGDSKLGNTPVIIDADGDGQLDGFFGSRYKYLLRLNMSDLSLTERRSGWVQCGCQTTAMDVDQDGRWDLFAGSGDDSHGKGVLHRYDPITLKSVWSFKTNDNASSADAVLVDIDGDGRVEVIKSVDNYRGDDAHDAIYALETDGSVIWKTTGFSGEDSPNAADLDGDGQIEIVGMTFGGEVYCLDSKGRIKWRKDLRPELDDHDAHAYLTPALCDINGDRELEIVAFTSGGYFDAAGKPNKNRQPADGVIFALSASGDILDRFEVGGPRYWGGAFVCNVDDDPQLEIVAAGSGGLDVIETKGFGPNTEHFQRRRNYQRLNVAPWAYEDSYFIYRGSKKGVTNLTDNLVLAKSAQGYLNAGTYTTELLTLPPDFVFESIAYQSRTPQAASVSVRILDKSGKAIRGNVPSGATLAISQPVRLEFTLKTSDPQVTPTLDFYSLSFGRPTDPAKAPGGTTATKAPPAETNVLIEVAAGEFKRESTPLVLALPKSLRKENVFTLRRSEGGDAIPIQIVAGDSPQLMWMLEAPLAAGQTRRYRLTCPKKAENSEEPTSVVRCEDDGSGLVIRSGKKQVLRYNHSVVPSPDPKTPYYARSGHLHPVFTPSGKQVTDDFAPDHPHQHGVMFAWTNTTYEGRAVNFWDQQQQTGRVEHVKTEAIYSGPVCGGFSTVIGHNDLTVPGGEKRVLSETWGVRAFDLADGFLFDLTSTQSVVGDRPLRINQHHYGGPAIRGNRQWLGADNSDFLTSELKTRKDGNHSRPRWVDLRGKVDGEECGIAVLTHPENFRFPQPVRLHPSKPYFCLSPMVLGEFEIEPRQPYRTRLRFFAHDGPLSVAQAQRLWNDFAHPPTVRIMQER